MTYVFNKEHVVNFYFCHSFVGNIENLLLDNNSNITITKSFSSVTLLEGSTLTLSCTPSMMNFTVLWASNGMSLMQRRNIRFFPSRLSHTLTIENATVRDSGIYTCSAVSDNGRVILAGENITANVLLGIKSLCLLVST